MKGIPFIPESFHRDEPFHFISPRSYRVFPGALYMNQNAGNFGWYIKWNGQFRFGPTGIFGTMGAFHSTQKSGNFGWYTKWNGSFRFGPTGIVGTSFVPSTALLYPASKNNNLTRGGLGRVCATGMQDAPFLGVRPLEKSL